MKMIKIAMQGIEGSFHETAVQKYFTGSEYRTVPCHSFQELFDGLKEGKSDLAVVAIENSIAGSLLPNYALLTESGMKIAGEVYLRIRQHLMALPGQQIEDIEEIYSHPMALQQCRAFLNPMRRKGVKLIDTEDTALSAKKIAQKNIKHAAAVAGQRASEVFGLNIIARGIETNKNNFTRFLIITDNRKYDYLLKETTPDKATLCFVLPHEEGSLAAVLSVFSYYKINLTKIQSLPLPGRQWEYLFYIDVTFRETGKYRQALSAIKPLTTRLIVLGEYKEGGKL